MSTPGDRETLRERARPVADAWLGRGWYGEAAHEAHGVTAFAIDLDTRVLFPPVGDTPLNATNCTEDVNTVAERLDDDVLDAIARIWHRGRGDEPPPEPGAGGAKIEVEGWRSGDLVLWDGARPSLRADTYVFVERRFGAIELYCVEPDCTCGEAIVDFGVIVPRGAPHPGRVEMAGDEATLCPEHERQRARLAGLWAAYRERDPHHRERFARRSAIMRGLAGRIVAAPLKPNVGRNGVRACGSGKKFKNCCGATWRMAILYRANAMRMPAPIPAKSSSVWRVR